MSNITRYVWGEHGMYKDTCGYYVDAKEYDRLTAQLAERDEQLRREKFLHKQTEQMRLSYVATYQDTKKQLAERDDVLSARFNENKELYMHWQQALTETTTLRTKLTECEKEVERLKNRLFRIEYNGSFDSETARKQAAQEIIDELTVVIEDDLQCISCCRDFIKAKFGLEG